MIAAGHRGGRARRAPLVVVAVAVAAALLTPVGYLLAQAAQLGAGRLREVLVRHLVGVLLLNTVKLAVCTAAACAVIGTAAAWCTERTALPARRLWQVALVLPAAIPDFVSGYAWSSALPAVHGLGGAILVMTLGLYPFVYLPVAAALRRVDPAAEETARSLGAGPMVAWWRAVVPAIRPALSGGCLVVVLALFAEYGAFEVLRFQTITTGIFVQFQLGFDSPAAAALSAVVVALGIAALVGDRALRRRPAALPATVGARRPPTRQPLRRATAPVLAGLGLVVVAAVGVPVGTIAYWLGASHSTTLPGLSLWSALGHTVAYAAPAAALAALAAIPVALVAARRRGALGSVLERSPYLVECVPGVVVALALVSLSIHHLPVLYQRPPLLVVAYATLFFPLAYLCVRSCVGQAPARLEEAARTLGLSPLAAFGRVTLPLIAPGVAAGFCLVFLSAVTELTATLVLAPTGVRTLATQFWAFETNTSYGAAAPYAAAMVVIAVGPSYVLSRWFDRRPQTAASTTAAAVVAGPASPGTGLATGIAA